MASLVTHGFTAVALGAALKQPRWRRRAWVAGIVCAILPDADVIGFSFGIDYGDPLGHRGLSHSLPFAALVATVMVAVWCRPGHSSLCHWRLWVFTFLATASHGVLDAFTNGGLGIALFAPFDQTRHFFPYRPLQVSPIGFGSFFTARGMAVIVSELVWVWLPILAIGGVVLAVRRRRDPTDRSRPE
jgi:inner membrane protein